MILYAETNFLLELALQRPEHDVCERLLEASEQGRFSIALPSFCIGEAYSAWLGRSKRRRRVTDELLVESRELSRSKPYEGIEQEAKQLLNTIVQSVEDERRDLNSTLKRLLRTVDFIPLQAPALQLAIAYQEEPVSLAPHDALVLAAILSHLQENPAVPKLFITKNSNDFNKPAIVTLLENNGCKLLFRFRDAEGYLRSR